MVSKKVTYYGVGRNFTVKSGKHNNNGLMMVGENDGIVIFTDYKNVCKYKKHCQESEKDPDAYYRLLNFGTEKPKVSPMILNPQVI